MTAHAGTCPHCSSAVLWVHTELVNTPRAFELEPVQAYRLDDDGAHIIEVFTPHADVCEPRRAARLLAETKNRIAPG